MKSGKDEFHLVPLLFESYSGNAVELVLARFLRGLRASWAIAAHRAGAHQPQPQTVRQAED